METGTYCELAYRGGGVRLWYTVTGPEWGSPILLLPDLDLTHRIYDRTAASLAEDRLVARVEWAGTGLSSPPDRAARLDHEFYAAQARCVAKAAFQGRPYSLVAHGAASLAAVWMATRFGGELRSLLLLAPAGLGDSGPVRSLCRCLCWPVVRAKHRSKWLKRDNLVERFEFQFVDDVVAKREERAVFAHWEEQLDQGRPFQATVERAYRDTDTRRPRWYVDGLSKIGAQYKIFLAWGAEDDLIPAGQMLRYGPLLPQAVTELFKSGGHAFFLEKHTAVSRAIRLFLDNADPVLTRPPPPPQPLHQKTPGRPPLKKSPSGTDSDASSSEELGDYSEYD